MSDAFAELLANERASEAGSNFRLALESVAGSTRALADELGISQREVQRWNNYDTGSGRQSRNPERSSHAGDLKALADVEREQRALNRIAEAQGFSADIDVDSVSRGQRYDEGSRQAYNRVPADFRPAAELYRQGAPLASVDAALSDAIAESYGLPGTVEITNVSGIMLH
jgi:hypothetical protein